LLSFARVRSILVFSLAIGCVPACEPGKVSIPPGPMADPGHLTAHRLNNSEYNNTVRDLLGTERRPADDFPADDVSYGFDNISAALSISPVQSELYRRAAAELADEVMSAAPERVLVCQPDPADPIPCVRDIAASFGKRAWRRPLTDSDIAQAVATFQVALDAGGGVEEGVELLVEYFLSSPRFLFRFEIDPDPTSSAARPLDDYQLASRLSYFLWSSMPDDELMSAADAGLLTGGDQLAGQIDRMLADPRAEALADNFAGQWLYLRGLAEHEPDATAFPTFDPDLRAAMIEETRAFFREFLTGDRPVQEMLSADFTFVDPRLAAHYGVTAAGEGSQRVSLVGTPRRGLLGQAGILTVTSYPNRTSPVKRGKWVLEELLCEPPPPPPPGVEGLEEGGATTGSIREQMEQHRNDPVCASCHQAMDPIGFALEHFDAIGAWRDVDGEYTIDATGELPDGTTFDGGAELAAVLAADPRFTRCLSEKMLIYALGRGLEPFDDPAVDGIHQQLLARGSRLRDLVALVAQSDPFLYRRGQPEVSP
jgi:hypothetical protein